MRKVILILTILNTLLLGGVFFMLAKIYLTAQKENRYYAITNMARLIPMRPLSHATVDDHEVKALIEKATQESLNFNHVNYRDNLQRASRFFTQTGWEDFSMFIKDRNMIEYIERMETFVQTETVGPVTIVSSEKHKGYYQWHFRVPVTLNIYGSKKDKIFDLTVRRVSRLEAENGIGITAWKERFSEAESRN